MSKPLSVGLSRKSNSCDVMTQLQLLLMVVCLSWESNLVAQHTLGDQAQNNNNISIFHQPVSTQDDFLD